MRALLAMTALAAGVHGAVTLRALMVDDWLTGAGQRALETVTAIGTVVTLCFFGTWVAMAVWTGRMYRTLGALGVGELRFSPGWGTGAWFVPFLSLFRPKQIVDELWRATDPCAGPSWRIAPVSRLVHAWWVLLLLSGLLAPRSDAEAIARMSVERCLIGTLSMVLASALGWWVTSRLTARLESAALRRGQRPCAALIRADGARARSGTCSPFLVAGLVVLGVAAGTAIPLGAAPEPDLFASASTDGSTPPAVFESRPTSVFDLEIGDCIGVGSPETGSNLPDGEIGTVDVVPCELPHTHELIDVVQYMAPSRPPFPGDDALSGYGFEWCAERFEAIVGTPLLRSELDIQVVQPTEESWLLGDREIQCLALRVDGAPLEGTVVGSGS